MCSHSLRAYAALSPASPYRRYGLFGFGACALWATYAAAGALLAERANTRAIFDRSHEDEGNGWNHSTV